MAEPSGESVPDAMRPTFEAITRLTNAFCRERLTDEYAALCRRLVAALGRKRPSPLVSGRIETWACGTVYMVASNNFLFDKSQELYMTAGDICAAFGLAKTTGGTKATAIRNALKAQPYDPKWTVPSRLADHPYAWFIQVDGLIVDARHVPRAIQEAAFRSGLIPYVPEGRS